MSSFEDSGETYASPDGIGHEHRMLSPEQVQLSLPIAGPGPRILAYAIDFSIILVVQIMLLILLNTLGIQLGFVDELTKLNDTIQEGDPADATGQEAMQTFFVLVISIFVIVQVVCEWVYFIASEWLSSGQSVGKRIIKLRVVQTGGRPVTLKGSILRNLMRMVDVLPSNYLVGLTAILVSRESRRLGDFTADTLVIRLDQPPAAPPIALISDEERGVFSFSAEMLACCGPTEMKLARTTLRRVDELEPDAAAVVLERAATAIAQRIGYADVPAHQHDLFLRSVLSARVSV